MAERGSVLMLMPAAVLVVVVLASIAVDSAVVFLAERELAGAAAGPWWSTPTAAAWPGWRGAMAERGSVLMLMPAAVLVVVVLASIAVDSAVVFLAERELAGAAATAANDAAGAAVADAAFYADGSVVVDPDRARRVVAASLGARGGGPVAVEQVDVAVDGARVTVALRGRVARVFTRAIPGAPRTAEVDARATATAVVR